MLQSNSAPAGGKGAAAPASADEADGALPEPPAGSDRRRRAVHDAKSVAARRVMKHCERLSRRRLGRRSAYAKDAHRALSLRPNALRSLPLCNVTCEAHMPQQHDFGRLAETLLIVFLLATVNAGLFSIIYRMLR